MIYKISTGGGSLSLFVVVFMSIGIELIGGRGFPVMLGGVIVPVCDINAITGRFGLCFFEWGAIFGLFGAFYGYRWIIHI